MKLKIFGALLLIAAIAGGVWYFYYYKRALAPNIITPDNKEAFLLLPTGSTVDTLLNRIEPFLINKSSFEWMLKQKNYTKVKPGRFRITPGMNNKSIVNMLIIGKQVPIRMTFHNVHFKNELAGRVDKFIEADSASIYKVLNNDSLAAVCGFNHESFLCMFIPNTYEMFWTTTASQFVERMKKEYDRYWTPERLQKAQQAGLTPEKAIIMASIVQEETPHRDEYQRIAGVYMNRLNKGMMLQADPTLKYAAGDFTLRRILDKHRVIESPYNTYMHTGLPPGPVCIVEPPAIDAVLNYEKHNYLYFCARPDNTMYANFAVTFQEHQRNADKYHQYLESRGIR